jgi:tetratricopeptide (TPR) repeat protein
MTLLGVGLSAADHHEDELSVREVEVSMRRRLGHPEAKLLVVQGNLANTYTRLGRYEEANRLLREVYSGWLRFKGEEHYDTLLAANNYAHSFVSLRRFEEAKALQRKMMPVARRVLGESHELALHLRWNYALTLHKDPSATLADLREAVTTLEDAERTARRVLGGGHPTTEGMEESLRNARKALVRKTIS